MDSNLRLIAKSVSWQTSGILMMTLICYLVTGSLDAGGIIAVVSAAVGLATFYLHEKLWSRISWGRVLQDRKTDHHTETTAAFSHR